MSMHYMTVMVSIYLLMVVGSESETRLTIVALTANAPLGLIFAMASFGLSSRCKFVCVNHSIAKSAIPPHPVDPFTTFPPTLASE